MVDCKLKYEIVNEDELLEISGGFTKLTAGGLGIIGGISELGSVIASSTGHEKTATFLEGVAGTCALGSAYLMMFPAP